MPPRTITETLAAEDYERCLAALGAALQERHITRVIATQGGDHATIRGPVAEAMRRLIDVGAVLRTAPTSWPPVQTRQRPPCGPFSHTAASLCQRGRITQSDGRRARSPDV
jgi:hypothetical protein